MQVCQPLPRFYELPKIRGCPTRIRERDTRQIALQICLIPLPILRMMQDTIAIVENVPLRDARIAVMRTERR